MKLGASSPEELESLMEDAFVTCDRGALAELFADGAVLLTEDEGAEARGDAQIAQRAASLCERGYRYLADPQRVLRSRDTTLVVARHAVNVMRRGTDGRWRFAISLLRSENPIERSKR
jgi:ketosteroid isomerase-like protein